MTRFGTRSVAQAVLVGATLATAAGAWGASAVQSKPASSAATGTLVVDRSFEIKTADPQRAFEPTASIVDRGIYDTFFTYKGGDLAHPIPLLVQSWTASKDAKTFVFNLRRNVHFADGTPLTSADAVFSFRRLDQPEGEPVLPARRRHRLGARQVHGRPALDHPATALPSILTNTSLGIVNSKLVRSTAAPPRSVRTNPTRPSSGSTLRPPRRGQRPVPVAALQHHLSDHARAEPALLGVAKGRRSRRS